MKQSILHSIIKPFTSKPLLKIVSVFLILGLFFVVPTFATSATNDATTLTSIQDGLSKLLGLFSRVWIFLAIIAGKLMTNEFVYGAFMNMDIYLWKIRNIMKNFANFALVAMILRGIIQYVVKKGKDGNPKDIVVNALIAGILIQASWFMVGAFIDLSTIATSAIASFPAKFIDQSTLSTTFISEETKVYGRVFHFKTQDGKLSTDVRTSNNTYDTNGLESFMPTYDSVSGPLMYIGFSALKIQEYMDTQSLQMDKTGAIIINFLLKVLILGFFVLVLALLCIANVIRIVFLRLLILGSPLLILAAVFFKGEKGKGMAEYLNVGTFIDLIFKPVFFVGFLSLTLIFITSMQSIMIGEKPASNINGVMIDFTGGTSTLDVNGVSHVEINENMFKDLSNSSRSLFADLIIFFMTIFLLRYLMKLSVEYGKGPVQDVMKKLTPLLEQFAGNLPIAPVAGGIGFSQIKSFKEQEIKRLRETTGIDISTGNLDVKGQKFLEEQRYGQDQWLTSYNTELSQAINGDDFFKKSAAIAKTYKEGISLADARWGPLFKQKLQAGPLEINGITFPQRTGNVSDADYRGATGYSTHKGESYGRLKELQEVMKGQGVDKIRDKNKKNPTETTPKIDYIYGGTE